LFFVFYLWHIAISIKFFTLKIFFGGFFAKYTFSEVIMFINKKVILAVIAIFSCGASTGETITLSAPTEKLRMLAPAPGQVDIFSLSTLRFVD
jgi:hypothetical protein